MSEYAVKPLEPVYTYKEAQKLLGISRTSLFELINQKVFSVVYVGERNRLIKGESIAAFLESRTTKAAAQPGGKRVDNHA